MSDFEWDDDDLETNDGNAMKELRKAYKKLQAEKKELAEQLDSMQSSIRERSVKDVIASKGLPEKVAALIPKDATTSEDVENWLSEYGEIFGIQETSEATSEPKAALSPEMQSLSRIAETQSSGQPFTNDPDQIAGLIAGADNAEALNKLLFGSAAGPQAS
jgi:HSP90 family molecular chaperone